MTVVHNIIQGPDGEPIEGAVVTVTLVAGPSATNPGFTTGATIEGVAALTTGPDGSWLIDLTPNVDITPAGTYYRITEALKATGQRYPYTVKVPATGGPYNVLEVLVAQPMPPDPRAPVGGGSGGGGAVDSVDGRTGVVTLTDKYAPFSHTHTFPVTSVNAKTGSVTLTFSDVGAAAVDHTHTFPVTSVAGKTGAVTLTFSDVGAASAGHTHTFPVTSVAGKTGDVTLTASNVGAAATVHTHGADDITSGVLSISRLPVGASSSSVAAGNHTHGSTGGSGGLPDGMIPMSGRYSSVPLGTVGPNLSTGVGAEFCVPLPVDGSGAITALSVDVAVAGGTGAKVRLGIRVADATRRPGVASLALDAGTVDSTSTGAKTLTLATPFVVSAGTVYWISVVGQVSGCTLRALSSSNPYVYDATPPTGTGNSAAILQNGVTGALPVDFVFNSSDFAPRVGVRWQ